jgi:hypothetical protein
MDRHTRDELIRRLKSMGWSLRRIANHEQVQLSAPMVLKILRQGPAVELDLPDDGEVATCRTDGQKSGCGRPPERISIRQGVWPGCMLSDVVRRGISRPRITSLTEP